LSCLNIEHAALPIRDDIQLAQTVDQRHCRYAPTPLQVYDLIQRMHTWRNRDHIRGWHQEGRCKSVCLFLRLSPPRTTMLVENQMCQFVRGVQAAAFRRFHLVEENIGLLATPQGKRIDGSGVLRQGEHPRPLSLKQMYHVPDGTLSQSPDLT